DEEAGHARRAEQEAREQLWQSYLDQARARRWSGRAGHRFDSLNVLKTAAEIRPSLELRNEAIACVSMLDVRPVKTIERSGFDFVAFDAAYQRYVKSDDAGS